MPSQFKIYNLRFKINESGLGQLAVLLLLVGGIALGTYLVQNRTNLLPQAAGTTACDGQSLSGQSEETKAAFQAAYGGGAAEAWVNEHEQELKAKGLPCGSSNTGSANNTSSNQSNSRTSTNNANRNNQSSSQTNQASTNKQSCSDANAPQRSDGYKWAAYCDIKCVDFDNNTDCPENSSDGFINPKTSRWCFGFKEGGRCLKLVTTSDPEANNQVRINRNTEANRTGNTRTATVSDAGSSLSQINKQSALTNIDKFKNKFQSDVLNKTKNAAGLSSNFNEASAKALDAFNRAKAAVDKCGDSDQTCLNEANKVFDLAKVASRLTAYYAIQSNVKEVCARIDLGINPSIKGKPVDTTLDSQQVYLCSGENGTDRKWRWFPSANIAEEFADKAKWKPNAKPDQYPEEVKQHIKDAEVLVFGTAKSTFSGTNNPSSQCNPACQSPKICRAKTTGTGYECR